MVIALTITPINCLMVGLFYYLKAEALPNANFGLKRGFIKFDK